MSSSDDEDEGEVEMVDVNFINIPEQIGDVDNVDRLSTITRCLLYTCSQSVSAVVVKLLEIWGSPDYDGKAFNITLSKPGITVADEVSAFTVKRTCLKTLDPLIEPGYITFKNKLSVKSQIFSKHIRGYSFNVLSLDDALEIAKERYNAAIVRRRGALSLHQAIRRRFNTVVVALVSDPKEKHERKIVKRKVRELVEGDNCKGVIIWSIDEAATDYNIGGYYDMVFRCGESAESQALYDARKEHASQHVWGKRELHFDDEDDFLRVAREKIHAKGSNGHHKKRKKN